MRVREGQCSWRVHVVGGESTVREVVAFLWVSIWVVLVENFLPPDYVDLGGSNGELLGDELVCFVRGVTNV